jgi:hypothetical protein
VLPVEFSQTFISAKLTRESIRISIGFDLIRLEFAQKQQKSSFSPGVSLEKAGEKLDFTWIFPNKI